MNGPGNGRSNGLRASAYAIIVEIEESLGDPVLAALAARDIAAYVEPTRAPGGGTRLSLYVDVLRRAAAAGVLATVTPETAGAPSRELDPAVSASDDDAAFAALVEAFHRAPDERTWPDAEDLPAAGAPPEVGAAPAPMLPAETIPPGPRPSPPRPVAKKFDPLTDIDRRRPLPPVAPPEDPVDPWNAAEDDEEHYTPPPLPRLDPPPFAIRWALLGLLLGLAMLLLPTFLDTGHQTSLDIAGVVCVIGSGALLVSRLRDRSPDDPDDGAVV